MLPPSSGSWYEYIRGGEILSIYTIPFCKTVGKGMESGDRCLVWANRDSGLGNYAASPYKGPRMHPKKTDWQLIFQSNHPSKCSPGVTLLNFLWCVSSGREITLDWGGGLEATGKKKRTLQRQMSLNRSGICTDVCSWRERTTPLMESWPLLEVKFHTRTKQLQYNTITVLYITMFMILVSKCKTEGSEEAAPHTKFHYLQENQIFFYH